MNSQIENESSASDNDESIFLGSVGRTADENDEDIRACDIPNSIKHMEYENESSWKEGPPKQDPIIKVSIETIETAYTLNKIPIVKSSKTSVAAIADTGARTTVAGTALLSAIGVRTDKLFPVQQKLCSANSFRLLILGGLFLKNYLLDGETNRTAETLCYIQNDCPKKFFLSRTVCENL